MSRLGIFFGGLICGGAAGVALGMLTAPKAGDEIRKTLLEASENIYRKAAYELEELSGQLEEVRHKADVIEANDSINAEPAISKAQDAVRDAAETTSHSQQLLSETPVTQNWRY